MKYIVSVWAIIAATICAATPANAYSVSLDKVTCPMETIGDEAAGALGRDLSSTKSAPSDAQLEMLTAATNACAAKHGWSKEDSKSALDFNAAVLSAIGLEDRLRAAGVEATEFESVLDDQMQGDLQAIVDGAPNNPIIDKAIEMLAVQQGDKINEEMAGNLGAYLVQVARTQLLAMKMIGDGE